MPAVHEKSPDRRSDPGLFANERSE